ncbi:MAG: hypothetical protein LBM96_13220 [Methanobrevibacter sp.]|jgi:hypothetical protein|nr:hypothetical protein [Candidatus Methanoflexus mossambicus]
MSGTIKPIIEYINNKEKDYTKLLVDFCNQLNNIIIGDKELIELSNSFKDSETFNNLIKVNKAYKSNDVEKVNLQDIFIFDFSKQDKEKIKAWFDTHEPKAINKDIETKQNNDRIPKPFNSYSEDVKNKAIEVIEDKQVINYFYNAVALNYYGNVDLIKIHILALFSVILGIPIHIILNSSYGKGKSELMNQLIRLIPKEYLVISRSISDKLILYKMENLNEEIAIFIFNDVNFTDGLLDVAKLLTDNTIKIKKHETLINQKLKEFVLNSKNSLCFFNYAVDKSNDELLSRCILTGVDLNINENKLNEFVIKQMINKEDINKEFDKKAIICQAIYQYFIENKEKFIKKNKENTEPIQKGLFEFQKENKMNIRDMKHLISLIEVYAFITNSEVFDNDNINKVIRIIGNVFKSQNYKLNDSDKKIIKYLQDDKGSLLDEYQTVKEIVKGAGISQATIYNCLNGKKDSANKGLIAKGIVDVNRIDKEYKYKINEDFTNYNFN